MAGALFVYGLYWFYKALKKFEASRVIPAIGGALPIFVFLLIYFFSFGKTSLNFLKFLGFILLIFGSVLISYKKEKKVSFPSLKVSLIAAFFLALSFTLAKYVYLELPFWSGFILMRIGGFLLASLYFFPFLKIKKELFKKDKSLVPKTAAVFIFNQSLSAGAGILQNWAIFLAPLSLVPVINALQGTQYVFLLVLAICISLKFPKILKEEISGKIIIQKISAILLITAGLFLIIK